MVSHYPITAWSVCNALGGATPEVLAALFEGRSGLLPCTLDVPFETSCGALARSLPPPPASFAALDSRQLRVALGPVEEIAPAVRAASRRFGRDRVAVVLGTSTAGLEGTERAYGAFRRSGALPQGFDWDRQHAAHALLEFVRAATSAGGPGLVLSTACSSSGKAFGSAHRLLDAGACDAVLVGGVDSLCQTTLRGFHSLEVLSRTPCRPFSAARNGISIGEGAAFVLVERSGDGLARLLGEGETSDAHHMTAPLPDGGGARAAMEEALRRSGLTAADVDHVNAHGTGTQLNDAAEAKAIAQLFGGRVPVASTKGYTGHLLGAAGATEAVFSLASIERGFVPRSLGAEPVDPALPIDVATARLDRPCRVVLSNSLAFGGSNVCVAFGAAS